MSKLAIEDVSRTFPGVRGGAPTRVVGCLRVRLEGRLVAVDLVEEEVVFVLLVLQHVEPETARFVAR